MFLSNTKATTILDDLLVKLSDFYAECSETKVEIKAGAKQNSGQCARLHECVTAFYLSKQPCFMH